MAAPTSGGRCWPIDRRTPRSDGFHNLLGCDPALRLIDKLLDARRDVPSCLQSVPMLSRFESRAFVPGQQVSVRRALSSRDLLRKVFVASISKNRHRQNSTYSLDRFTIAQYRRSGPTVTKIVPGTPTPAEQIIALLNVHKPRDRSHYERFAYWHAGFYRAVEATSVTQGDGRPGAGGPLG